MSNIREIYMAFHDTKNRLHRKRVLLLRKRDSVCFLYAEKGKAVMKKTNDVSRLAGVSRRTLQYYDDEGLLPVERSSQNYRLYSDSDLERIWEILIYKEMDFKLREIKQLQTAFISMVKNRGMPEKPNQEEKMTYVDRIEEIKRIIHEKFIK